jgi:hypothetical protein
VYLNALDMSVYEELKVQARCFSTIASSDAEALRYDGLGPATMFEDMVRYLSVRCGGARVSDLVPTTSDLLTP